MSCLPIVSDRAATEGSKYFELGRQPHEFLTRNTCCFILGTLAVSVPVSRFIPHMIEEACLARLQHW